MFISNDGQQYEKKYGSRLSVWEGTSFQPSSGLQRSDLKQNRRGKIVSIVRSKTMAQRYKQFGGLKKKEKKEEETKEEQVFVRNVPKVSNLKATPFPGNI